MNRAAGAKHLEVPKPESPGAGPPGEGVQASNIVWIFGFGRSGSTWLSSVMGEMENHTVWQEPALGALFGNLYYGPGIGEAHHNSPSFILGAQREIWSRLIRAFVLDGARAMFPEVSSEGTMVVKDPAGAIGAPLLMEALPESRIVLLIRDPRDVLASIIDAFGRGSWGSAALGADNVPHLDVEEWADLYLRSVAKGRQAYENHIGRKALLRYEDLRADTLGTMTRAYSALEITVGQKQLAEAVEKHSWEAVPEEQKGPGRFYRKARPGGWKDDLTAEQVAIVERVTAPILEEFYS